MVRQRYAIKRRFGTVNSDGRKWNSGVFRSFHRQQNVDNSLRRKLHSDIYDLFYAIARLLPPTASRCVTNVLAGDLCTSNFYGNCRVRLIMFGHF